MDMPVRPGSLYDREAEWGDLSGFASSPRRGLRLGIVYGRRRFGKSFLLRRLVEAAGGVYHLALREEPRPALDRFAGSLGQQLRWGPSRPLRDWMDAVGQAVAVLGTRGTQPQLLVIDEYPYLQQKQSRSGLGGPGGDGRGRGRGVDRGVDGTGGDRAVRFGHVGDDPDPERDLAAAGPGDAGHGAGPVRLSAGPWLLGRRRPGHGARD